MRAAGRTIAVTGATGRQGGAVARHLLADGWRVRALTRAPRSRAAHALSARGAEIVVADMADHTALLRAFEGSHGVYSVQNPFTSGFADEVVQGKNVADAAASTGVHHLVYGSAGVGVPSTGVRSWETKLEIEAHLRAVGLPVTVLRPMAFMELMTDRAFYPALSTWHVMPALMGADRPVGWLAVDDLGAITARVFADPDRFVGEDLHLVGDVQSIAQCRGVWRQVTGRHPRRIPIPTPIFERLAGRDLPTMWRWLRTAEFAIDPAFTRAILPTALTVRMWLKAHRSSGERLAGPGR